jgi:CelD/BcsL family acetyltransferase involved in cellulose biosynthesis
MSERLLVHVRDAIPDDALALEHAPVANPHALPIALRVARDNAAVGRFLTCRDAADTLIGLWPFSTTRFAPGIRILRSPLVPLYDLSGNPLIAADRAVEVLRALVLELKQTSPERVVMLRNLQAEGPVWDALLTLRESGLVSLQPLEQWQRAILDRSAATTAHDYITQSLSAGNRKHLRRKRKALEEQSLLSLIIHDHPDSISRTFDRFLDIEASGWKGRNGSALKQKPYDARYVLTVLRAMSGVDRAFIAELRMGETPIASGLFLRCGAEAFFWKTTYDETFASHSPGVIFDMILTQWFYDQPWFQRLDTGIDDSVDPARLIWKQRRPMANVIISLDPHSLQGRTVVAGLRLRRWAKTMKNRIRAADHALK